MPLLTYNWTFLTLGGVAETRHNFLLIFNVSFIFIPKAGRPITSTIKDLDAAVVT